jgi:hypothetical protein
MLTAADGLAAGCALRVPRHSRPRGGKAMLTAFVFRAAPGRAEGKPC